MADFGPAEVSPKQAATLLGRSVRWLCEARRITRAGRSYGPEWIKRCGRIVYRTEELLAWKERGRGE